MLTDTDDDDVVTLKVLAASVPLTPLIWAHTIYVAPTVDADVGQVNVPLNEPFVIVAVELTAVSELQLLLGLYPKVTVAPDSGLQLLSTIPLPVTVTVVLTGPDVGLLAIEGAAHA